MSVVCCALCVVLVSLYVRINVHRNKYNAQRTTDNGHLTTQTTPFFKHVGALTKDGSHVTQNTIPSQEYDGDGQVLIPIYDFPS